MLLLIGLLISSSLSLINCYCQSKTFYATEDWQIIQHSPYGSKEDCVFTFQPSNNWNQYFDYSKYINYWQKKYGYIHYDYFLEISWISFDIKANMPDCSNNYVEIFLTKEQKSIGRFCSSNLVGSKLFNMYSYDGNAKIKFHYDGSKNEMGFKLKVRLRKTSSDYLGNGDSDWCNAEYLSGASDLYSPKWPHEYEYKDNDPCKFKIDLPGTKKIIFMDLNMKRYNKFSSFCNSFYDDNIQIKGASSASVTFAQASVIKSPFCSSNYPVSITTKDRYVYVRFTRQVQDSSNRGFVAGYVTYLDEPKVSTPTKLVTIVSAAGSLCALVIIIGIICCCCHRRSKKKLVQNQPIANQNPNQNAGVPVTYSAFKPTVGYQGPYQQPQMYPNDMPPPYSPYDASVQSRVHMPVADNFQYQSQPAYNPSYHPPTSESAQAPSINTRLLP